MVLGRRCASAHERGRRQREHAADGRAIVCRCHDDDPSGPRRKAAGACSDQMTRLACLTCKPPRACAGPSAPWGPGELGHGSTAPGSWPGADREDGVVPVAQRRRGGGVGHVRCRSTRPDFRSSSVWLPSPDPDRPGWYNSRLTPAFKRRHRIASPPNALAMKQESFFVRASVGTQTAARRVPTETRPSRPCRCSWSGQHHLPTRSTTG